MANAWNRNKVDSSTINNGNEYEKGDRVSRQNLNAMVNAGLYAQDFAEKLVTNIDTSEIGNVGTPSIVLVDGDGATTNKPYKKFKFSNLKGDKGETGEAALVLNEIIIDASTGDFPDGFIISNTRFNRTPKVGDNLIYYVNRTIENKIYLVDGAVYQVAPMDAYIVAPRKYPLDASIVIDQALSETSTNAIANKIVKEEFNKTVYQSNFENENTTSFGDYVVEKKKVLFTGTSESGTSAPSITKATGSITLSESVNVGDILEICFSGNVSGKIYHKFVVTNATGTSAATYLKTERWYSSAGSTYNYIYFRNALVYINGSTLTFTPFNNITLKFNGANQSPTQASIVQYENCTIHQVNKIIE